MTKLSKKLLALTVSVILASTAMLSGCGKIEGDSDEEKKTIKENVGTVFSSVSNTGETIEKALSGETDTGYSAELKIDLGELIVGKKTETITISAEAKAKNGNAQTIIGAKYGKDAIATLDMVRDGENGNVYIGIPELSPAYMLVTEAGAEQMITDMIEEEYGMSYDELLREYEAAMGGLENMDIPELDVEQLEESLEGYFTIVKDTFPQQADAGKITGEVGDVSYELDKKTVTLTEADAVNTVKALAEKLKTDDTMLDLMAQRSGMTKEELVEQIDLYLADVPEQGEMDNEPITFDIYYQDDTCAGFGYEADGSKVNFVYYITDSEFCLDFDITEKGVKEGFDMSATTDGYITNVDANFNADGVNMTFSIDDFKIVDEETGAFQGTMSASVKENGQTVASFEAKSDSTADKLDLSFSAKMQGEELISATLTGKKTKASDVKIPSGQVYDITDEDQMEQYGATVDTEAFEKRLEGIMGSMSGNIGGIDPDDYKDLMDDMEDLYGDEIGQIM